MRLRLLLRILYLTLPIAIWFGFVTFENDPTLYPRAIRVKQRLVMRSANPRIILAGGSNIAFSVDSARIEEAFRRPVINMGVSALLGMRFMLAQIEPYLKADDLVAMVPEHEEFYSMLDGTEELSGMLLSQPEEWKYLSERQLAHFIARFPGAVIMKAVSKESARMTIFQGVKPSRTQIYTAKGFDARGDFVAHLGKTAAPGWDLLTENLEHAQFNPQALEVLNRFAHAAERRGARVRLIWPLIPDSAYRRRADELSWLQRELSTNLEFPICGNPETAVLPLRYFFDSPYHANAEGRQLRTGMLIDQLLHCTGAAEPR